MSSSAFDALAADYDASFTDTSIGRELRGIVWQRMALAFEPGQQVLEIGCGTGEDALWLLRHGLRVTATDPSERMIAIAGAKVERAGLADAAEFNCVGMEGLGGVLAGRRFDAVFSNFGALNCVQDLPAALQQLAGLVKPGGPFIWVVMGRHVPWEWIWCGLRGEWRSATRRYRSDLSWHGIRLGYPTPAWLRSLAQPWFTVTRVLPLGFVLPPTYAAGWVDRRPQLFGALARLERGAARHARLAALLAGLSDHFILEGLRRPE